MAIAEPVHPRDRPLPPRVKARYSTDKDFRLQRDSNQIAADGGRLVAWAAAALRNPARGGHSL